ncbi:MAG: hypothetical protein ABF778_07030 [Liquorilactobacillus hordei]|uniref:hypothetical protein n=1 Tax=Liquorilactobacillus hordei TaxID=468911 RepID=UPI0039E99E43
MTEYKKGDKVVVEIYKVDTSDSLGRSYYAGKSWIKDSLILGKLEDFQPAEEKIKMTVEEKKEFDDLKSYITSLYMVFDEIDENRYPYLFKRLFDSDDSGISNIRQIDFAKIWDDPRRIEVIKPEHEFKVGDLVKDKINNKKAVVIAINDNPSCPIKISNENGAIHWLEKEDLKFIKSNAINWEDVK